MQDHPAFNWFFSRTTRFLVFVIPVFFSNPSFSQDSSSYENARERLVKTIKKRFIDDAFSQRIDRFYFKTCDSLVRENVYVEDRPVKEILSKFFLATEARLNARSITSLRIPALNNNFLLTLQVYKNQPINRLYREIGITQTAILQSAFDGLLLGDSIRTFVSLREMLNFPVYIANRIHLPRYARYRDTLLYYLANNAPDILVEKLTFEDSFFISLVSRSHNRTVQAVSRVKDDNYFDYMLPFSFAIYENRVSEGEIKKLTLLPGEYYHAFIEEALRLHNSPDPEISAYLKQRISAINRELANSYYINEINMLHNSPEKIRFRVVSALSAKDLYFLIIGGSNQLYTSSFLYIYKKFLRETEKEGLDKFFDDIGYYQFDQFISNISVYGMVNDLVGRLREEKFGDLMVKYLGKLQSTQLTDYEIILNAMTISEVLYDIRHFPGVKARLIAELESFDKPVVRYDILLQRMYRGLLDILQDRNEYNSDKTYDMLTIDRLRRNGAIVQAWFFYDDEDGCSSFSSGTSIFDEKTWDRSDKGNYVVFVSRNGNNMRVYMNKPNSPVGYDSAQDEMLKAIREEGYEPTSFIHRGHSYHLFQSFSKMTPNGEFVFLGSCGGTNEVLKVFQLNPDVNVIVTRHMGSKLINDQILERINREIVNNRDINWDVLWKDLNRRFRSKEEKDLFSSYIPPNKYIGVKFIRKVFNY